jgi:hypothetical protein
MNEAYYLSMVSIAAVLLALIVIDPNVGLWIDLQIQRLSVDIRRWWFMATMWPRLQIDHWRLQRELIKIREKYNISEDNNGDV